jgi:hypothetical protein
MKTHHRVEVVERVVEKSLPILTIRQNTGIVKIERAWRISTQEVGNRNR